ncbi:DUF6042 family protein [Streptomyces sp. NPDC053792]|uniref:DUF6042 family protein n=1 Tax=Streptomyces sp. NPDC053792 TaxID=3365716 RepID=UPI0037D2F4B3
MSVDQDTGQRNDDGYLSMHNGWFASCWPSYLPQHQSMALTMLFGTAMLRELQGTVDEVLEQVFKGNHGAFFGHASDSLDSPVQWSDGDEEDYAETEEEKAQIRSDIKQHQDRCEELIRGAGLTVPTTIRELADTMLDLGIVNQRDGLWFMPDPIPGPETVLPLSDEERARIAERRRFWEGGPAEQALIDHLKDHLDEPAEVFTSVDRLAKAIDLSEDEVRHALGQLFREGEARFERGAERTQILLEDLKDHERFHLVLDWEHFNKNRITITRG